MKRLKVYLIILMLVSITSSYMVYDYGKTLKERKMELKSVSEKRIDNKNIKKHGYYETINALKCEGVVVKKITEKKDKNIIEVEGEVDGDLLKAYECIKKISSGSNLESINNIKFEENKDCINITKVNMAFIKNK